jgi:hypothetical protein
MFNYFYLSGVQKVSLTIITILFTLFILILRPIILNNKLSSLNILTFSLLFFAWYGLTQILTNSLTYEFLYKSILRP